MKMKVKDLIADLHELELMARKDDWLLYVCESKAKLWQTKTYLGMSPTISGPAIKALCKHRELLEPQGMALSLSYEDFKKGKMWFPTDGRKGAKKRKAK